MVSILDPAPRRASPRRALPVGQHSRPEAAAIRAAGRGPRGLKGQKTRPKRWLEKKLGWNTTPLGPTLYARDRQNRVDQQALWWPTGWPFWNRQNTRVDCPIILLAESPPRHWGLCNRLQCLPSFEISKAQALWWPVVLFSPNASIERLVYGFCHRTTSFNQLEKRNLWLNPSYRWQTYENGTLQASQGNYQYPGPSRGHHWDSSAAPWPPGLNY